LLHGGILKWQVMRSLYQNKRES